MTEENSLHPPSHDHAEPRPIIITDVSHRWLRVLGGSRATTSGCESESQLNPDSRSGEHTDERIDAEQIDFAASKIADTRLGYTEQFRRSALGQLARFHQAPQFEHEVGAKAQTFRLLWAKAEIAEYITARPPRIYRHFGTASFCATFFGAVRPPLSF
jgi:hypothetical protein